MAAYRTKVQALSSWALTTGTIVLTTANFVATPPTVLPLTLVSFSGKEAAENIILQWTTSHEVNTAGFDIERSANGGAFVKVGTVAAGTAYAYCLKMHDKDGKFVYSSAITVKYAAKASSGYSVYPNPVEGSYLYVKPAAGNNTQVNIDVMDLGGRTCYTHAFTGSNVSNGRFEIPVKQLPAGCYLLRISDKNGESLQVTKFTVGR